MASGSIFEHKYALGYVTFTCLGAVLYGYDGVYFSGVQAMNPFVRSFGTRNPDGTYFIHAGPLAVMTSMINVGELVGSVGAALVNDYAGRKATWLLSSILVCLGCILQIVTDSGNLGFINGGRVILGVGVGGFAATGPIYIGEVAPAQHRGPMLIMWQMALSISQILAAGLNRGVEKYNDSFGWRFTTAFQMLFPLLIMISMFWVPESPRWLLRKGRRDKAIHALCKIHRDDKAYDAAAANREAEFLKAAVAAELSKSAEGAWSDLILHPIERRKMLFSAGALIAQQINGIQWFYYFGTTFSKDIGLQDPFLMTIIVFTIQLFVVTATMLLEVRIPRRPLMITCSCIMLFSIFMVGCMGIPNPGTTVQPLYGKVIITFVIVEICAANFSWGPLGWSMSSEYAVGPNRNRIFSVAVVCFWLSIWITVFTLPYLYYDANLGAKTGFVYTGLCIYTVGYAYFCVGEVRGRTIEEIEGFFRNKIPAKRWKDVPRLRLPEEGVKLEVVEKPDQRHVEVA